MDTDGAVSWARELPGRAFGVGKGPGGTSLLTGEVGSRAYVVLLQPDGTLSWETRINAGGPTIARSAIQTDAGYAIMGSTEGVGAGGVDLFVASLDTDGNLLSFATIGTIDDDGAGDSNTAMYHMIATDDGGMLVAAPSGASPMGILVAKLDMALQTTWTRRMTGGGDAFVGGLGEQNDGYVFVGEILTSSGLLTFSLDKVGDLKWARGYGPDPFPNYMDGGVADDGGVFILTESHNIAGFGSHVFYMLKLDREGRSAGCCGGSDVTLTAVDLGLSAIDQPSVSATVTSTPLAAVARSRSVRPLTEETICQQEASYFCNGIIDGPCLCEP